MALTRNLPTLLDGVETESPLIRADLNHTHIDVASYDRSQRFYEKYFGFKPVFENPMEHRRRVRFLRNYHGFTLGLELIEQDKLPKWFHLGFRLGSPGAVREAKLFFETTELPVLHDADGEEYVSFVVIDPDGHHLEIFWDLD